MTEAHQDDAVIVVPYDTSWPKRAEQEIQLIKEAFQGQDWLLGIEHVGSTAIPGLAAKPIIDLYLGARSIKEAKAAIGILEALGYQFWHDNPNPEKMFFVKGMPPFGTGRTHHVHIVLFGSDYWLARLVFRDHLRMHPEEIDRYATLKYDLMQKHGQDREAYTDAKADYISSILRKADFKDPIRR